MSRHPSTETFQMDLRSSPSQQNLDPSRSSSLRSQVRVEDMDQQSNNIKKPHKLDLYSIPVFLLEVIVLLGLAYLAAFIHFQYHHASYISGFYCDDTSFRQQFTNSNYTKYFSDKDLELATVVLLLAVPIVLVVFCELVNSMFGALKFRQIRALCTCCKLHSITRRSIRFSGAFVLGFMIVMISCDILAVTSGRLRPYFAQSCPNAYQQCALLSNNQGRDMGPSSNGQITGSTGAPIDLSQVVSANSSVLIQPSPLTQATGRSESLKLQRLAPTILLPERQWIDLNGVDLKELCRLDPNPTPEESYAFNQLAKSWPSFPAAIVTYTCLYLACYLCFVGTARPFRMISSVLVMILILLATIFNVQLVKEHYNHWDDVAAAAFLAFLVVTFVLLVYLNRFKDTHYYENQKLSKSRLLNQDSFKGYAVGEGGANGHYSLDKNDGFVNNNNGINQTQNGDTGGSISNNDLAMRYFQIPRANYRGAPRPISSLNHMRS